MQAGGIRNDVRVWQSLRLRLPLLLALLMALVLATFVTLAYREVRVSLLRTGSERAQAAADQIADLFAQPSVEGAEERRRFETGPDIRTYLKYGTPASEAAVRRELETRATASPMRFELWTPDGALMLDVQLAATTRNPQARRLPGGKAPTAAGLSALQTRDNEVVFSESVTAIQDASTAGSGAAPGLLGYLVTRSTFVVNPPGILDRLVGDGARVAIGNLAGGVWTDFSRVIHAPPVDLAHRGVRGYGSGAEGRYLGAVTPITNTSWAAWVEFPESRIVAPAQRVLNRMVGLALIFLVVGVGLVAAVSIGVTRPLRELSAVVARIGNGDYSGRIVTTRADEIGRLAEAFNGMTSEVARAYGALKQSHDDTHFALGAAHTGIWEVDIATNRLTWSDTMASIFGLTPGQAPRTIEEFYEVVHPDDRQLVRDAISQATEDHQDEFFVEYRSILPDGSVRWIEETARVVYGEGGGAASFLGVAMDVTGRKTLETQLRQAQKMEAIGQLAGGIAHDFNNLLTAILGYTKLLDDSLSADDVRRRDVHEIHDAAERAAGLTRQLLAFSRQQMLQPTPVNLNELVLDTSQLLRRLIGEHIHLVTSLNSDLSPVLADKTQLEQVIINLAVNARDAMPGGGTMSISTANVDLDETYATQHLVVLRPGPYVMLVVSDTGIGMSDATRRRVFEPFFTTKERGKGTGLGLATVYGIVKQSGGYVWVYSEPGRGAAFKMYLPRAERDADKATITQEPRPGPSGGTETVLVVEDEAAVRFLTRLILERAGYCVIDASNPEAAAAFCTDDVVLLISDVIMPGATGPTLYRMLAERHPRLKVLYMSGYTDDMVKREGMLDPETAFLQKPFSNDGLLRKVRDVLDR